jgi:hypothetical protein
MQHRFAISGETGAPDARQLALDQGLYGALAGSGPRRCAITVERRVECNRGWPIR